MIVVMALPQLAGIDDEVELLLQPCADFLGLGERRFISGQQSGLTSARGSLSSSSKASAMADFGTRRPMVLRFGCSSRRGSSRVPSRMKV
jgi:hypothetical protein